MRSSRVRIPLLYSDRTEWVEIFTRLRKRRVKSRAVAVRGVMSRCLHYARHMSTSDWLFVRGTECMWVRRSPATPLDLVIQGPGKLRRIGSFTSEQELREFQRDLRSRLVRTGWMLERIAAHMSAIDGPTIH
jgi:hypothetical protein